VRPSRIYICFSLTLWAFAFCGFTTAQSQSDVINQSDIIELTQAQLTTGADSSVSEISGLDSNWREITLPLMSGDLNPDELAHISGGGSLWLRLILPENAFATDNTQALFLWRYNRALTVYFNRTEIAGNGFRNNRTTIAWNHPLLAIIPAQQDSPNEVLIELHGSSWGANLAPVILGPANELQKRYESRLFMQVEINRILLAFAFTVGTFTLLLWMMRRKDSIYLWFSGVCFSWAFAASHTVILYNPFSFETWIPLVHGAMDIFTLFLY